MSGVGCKRYMGSKRGKHLNRRKPVLSLLLCHSDSGYSGLVFLLSMTFLPPSSLNCQFLFRERSPFLKASEWLYAANYIIQQHYFTFIYVLLLTRRKRWSQAILVMELNGLHHALDEACQSHLVHFWDELSPDQRSLLNEDLSSIDFNKVNNDFTRSQGKIRWEQGRKHGHKSRMSPPSWQTKRLILIKMMTEKRCRWCSKQMSSLSSFTVSFSSSLFYSPISDPSLGAFLVSKFHAQ